MTDHNSIIAGQAQALASLDSALSGLFADAMQHKALLAIIEKGAFSPAEDEQITYWFARFITIRHNLWSIVETGIHHTGGMDKLSQAHDYQYFVLGYSAVCLLIRMDRFLLAKVAFDSLIQRKLNEAFPRHRIPRKQFSTIYKAMLQPSNAIRIHRAHRILKKKRHGIEFAVADTPVEPIFRQLPRQERYLNLNWRSYLLAWLRSRTLSLRRRGASAKQKSLFTVLEYGGRLAADLALPLPKNVTPEIRAEVEALLRPGDIFVTRHSHALTNLFLPGFWPHAALYIGTQADQERLNIKSNYLPYWRDGGCTLEALKDGVHYRSLEDTLRVDAFVVIRPNFAESDVATALSRVSVHAGKGYNFDFDFFRSDQLVCTEVIYRAYDGLDNKNIPLQDRMGRKTLSAEDLLDLALDTDWGAPIAIYGVGGNKQSLVTGSQLNELLTASYR